VAYHVNKNKNRNFVAEQKISIKKIKFNYDLAIPGNGAKNLIAIFASVRNRASSNLKR